MKKLKSCSKFSSVEELIESFDTSLEFTPSDFGFIQPGHGLKGRQRWIRDDADLEEMYNDYPKKHDFLLWCYTDVGGETTAEVIGQKRSAPVEVTSSAPKPKLTCVRKINEVEDIIKDLKQRHGEAFTVEQFSMWAHVVHIGKHVSREAPPNLPFFRRHKSATPPSTSGLPGTSSTEAVSPGKRISLRSECMNQLDKWHSLLDRGIITQEQYEDMQKAILNDMFKF